MRVYVGGKYGEPPDVVATTLERAMELTVQSFLLVDGPFDQQWICTFIDGYPDQLRCTVTVTDDRPHALYVEAYDVDDRTAGTEE